MQISVSEPDSNSVQQQSLSKYSLQQCSQLHSSTKRCRKSASETTQSDDDDTGNTAYKARTKSESLAVNIAEYSAGYGIVRQRKETNKIQM